MVKRLSIWLLAAVVTLAVVTAPAGVSAETFMRSDDILRVSAYQVPVGMQLAGASAAYGAAMQSDGSGNLKTPEDYGDSWRWARTTGEIVLMNAIMTLFGKYFMDEHGFAVSLETIEENLKNGFEWDDNSFSANNFRHPYQGAQYFGAARSNHYDFWQSSMWSMLGAWLFEYMGEAHHPSYNDWITTGVGGIGLGEPLFRLQTMALDNMASGSGRVWRELGGFLILPLAGFNRMVTGAAFEEHENPPDRTPEYFGARFDMGTRTLGDDRIWEDELTKAYVDLYMRYGNAFEPVDKPYDAFSFRLQLTFDNKPHGISRLQSRGVLASGTVYESDEAHHLLTAEQHFDYVDNEAVTFGGQSVGSSFISRFWKGDLFEARTRVSLIAIILGANKSDYFNISGREYDYGPGAAYTFGVEFLRKKRPVFSVSTAGFWVHTINGTISEHYTRVTNVRIDLPLRDFLGVGANYTLFERESYYENYEDVKARNPELLLYLAWFM
jgi:hypothetical protein